MKVSVIGSGYVGLRINNAKPLNIPKSPKFYLLDPESWMQGRGYSFELTFKQG